MAEFERQIAARAGRQYGYITRRQLLAFGMGRRAIESWVRAGRLIPVHAGVYAVGSVNATLPARAMAAVLACGDGAALSHGSAATLWGFFKYWDTPFEVTVATSYRQRPHIKVHRSRTLAVEDRTSQLWVPVTTPARTVLDIAPRLTERRLTRVINNARHSRVVNLDALADVLTRNRNHPGSKRLIRFVRREIGMTRSELEDDFVAFAKHFGLPAPVLNTRINGYEVDVLFPVEKVIVEVDSWEFHRFRQNFEGDRDRDADMMACGYLTLRVTDERMNQRPEYEARRMNAILEARRRAA